MMKKKDKASPTHKERQGTRATWGDNGSARTTTDAYRDGWDAIFKKDVDKEK